MHWAPKALVAFFLMLIVTNAGLLYVSTKGLPPALARLLLPGEVKQTLHTGFAGTTRHGEEAAKAGLEWRGLEAFGKSYADTLAEWASRFRAKWDEISGLGFDERFKRLWLFYLGYCEAGFRSGRTDVIQLHLAKPG